MLYYDITSQEVDGTLIGEGGLVVKGGVEWSGVEFQTLLCSRHYYEQLYQPHQQSTFCS